MNPGQIIGWIIQLFPLLQQIIKDIEDMLHPPGGKPHTLSASPGAEEWSTRLAEGAALLRVLAEGMDKLSALLAPPAHAAAEPEALSEPAAAAAAE